MLRSLYMKHQFQHLSLYNVIVSDRLPSHPALLLTIMIFSPIAPLQCHFSPFTRCIVKKWKTKNSTLPEQFQNPIEEIVERGKIDTLNTHVHDLSRHEALIYVYGRVVYICESWFHQSSTIYMSDRDKAIDFDHLWYMMLLESRCFTEFFFLILFCSHEIFHYDSNVSLIR
jgi:hypothetical protein